MFSEQFSQSNMMVNSRQDDIVRLVDQLCVLKEKTSLTTEDFQSMLLRICSQQADAELPPTSESRDLSDASCLANPPLCSSRKRDAIASNLVGEIWKKRMRTELSHADKVIEFV
jgi:hypothetical protein